MTTGLKRRTLAAVCYMVFGLGTVALAQEPPSPTALPSPAASPAESGETARPLYGFQGVLVETLDGKAVSTQAEYDQFNPASNIKLATALVALQTFGPAHRFSTGVWADGTIDKTTGVLTG